MVDFTAQQLRGSRKSGDPRDWQWLSVPNNKAKTIPINYLCVADDDKVDEDDDNKCQRFTGSLKKCYHHTELMV